ncbi:hypothetical protein [Pedobacter psychroterrae]|uniref:Uncharacterized protein n=1 Tax=Pedobacter psychroterrae TaxID=2530453 RepID=A0A4R0NKW4_9SPHI|nr:hypothetical protein [Pedobacter psychroterrae]TCD01236.1 hypothetical protein EZ437_10795 [Pedobacter psychroterrae]
MKKQFLTLALLATVAVGGAIAQNSTGTTFPYQEYNCETGVDQLCSEIGEQVIPEGETEAVDPTDLYENSLQRYDQ